MARSKAKSTEEKLLENAKLISKVEEELAKLQSEREELLLQKKEEDKEEIYQKMLANGLSVDELLGLIKTQQ